MGYKTDPLPFPLGAEAIVIRAMATRARAAQVENGDGQEPAVGAGNDGADPGNVDMQALIREMRAQNQMLRRQPPPAPEVFKAPEYNGVGSVEIFIRHFSDVVDANGWARGTAFLHLRRALKEEASDCGSGDDVDEIFEALRARFGISPREARTKLSSLRRDQRTSLQEHATKVKELMRIAYAELPGGLHLEMSVDTFVNSLNHTTLQRHLLAIRPGTIAEAVVAGNEFLQLRTSSASMKQLEGMEEAEETETQVMPLQGTSVAVPALPTPLPPVPVQPVVTQPALPHSVQPGVTQPALTQSLPNPMGNFPQLDPMAVLMTSMSQLAASMEAIQRTMAAKGEVKKKLACYKCGQEGHIQRFCKAAGETKPGQENRNGQQ